VWGLSDRLDFHYLRKKEERKKKERRKKENNQVKDYATPEA